MRISQSTLGRLKSQKSQTNECVWLTKVKETTFSLYACGGLPSLFPINSPDIIEHIKGLSYLSDYRVIRASLGGAF